MKFFWILILVAHATLGQSSHTLTSLVEEIAQEGHFIYPDKENQYYLLLQAQASDQQLEDLTNHPVVNVRMYAFLILLQRKSPKIEKIFRQHLRDSVRVSDATQGCFIYSTPTVSEYMLGKMMTQDYPLTHMSYEDYWKKLDTINGNIIQVEVPEIEVNPKELEEDSL